MNMARMLLLVRAEIKRRRMIKGRYERKRLCTRKIIITKNILLKWIIASTIYLHVHKTLYKHTHKQNAKSYNERNIFGRHGLRTRARSFACSSIHSPTHTSFLALHLLFWFFLTIPFFASLYSLALPFTSFTLLSSFLLERIFVVFLLFFASDSFSLLFHCRTY